MNSFKYTFPRRIGQPMSSKRPLALAASLWTQRRGHFHTPICSNFQRSPSACELSSCGRPRHEAGFHGRHDLGQCGRAMVCADGGLVPPLQKFSQRASAGPVRGCCTMVFPYQEGILVEFDIAGALAVCGFPVVFHVLCKLWRAPMALADGIGSRQGWWCSLISRRGARATRAAGHPS